MCYASNPRASGCYSYSSLCYPTLCVCVYVHVMSFCIHTEDPMRICALEKSLNQHYMKLAPGSCVQYRDGGYKGGESSKNPVTCTEGPLACRKILCVCVCVYCFISLCIYSNRVNKVSNLRNERKTLTKCEAWQAGSGSLYGFVLLLCLEQCWLWFTMTFKLHYGAHTGKYVTRGRTSSTTCYKAFNATYLQLQMNAFFCKIYNLVHKTDYLDFTRPMLVTQE